MGRPPCCDKSNVKRGLWTAEEDAKILAHVSKHGTGNWTLVPQKAGLNRCGKSCRLRWTNYLRPDLNHSDFTPQEEDLIINLHQAIGSRWSLIAKQLPGRTDNDVKNYWNTKLRKKLYKMGIDPLTHKPFSQVLSDFGHVSGFPNPLTDGPNTNLINMVPQPHIFVTNNEAITNSSSSSSSSCSISSISHEPHSSLNNWTEFLVRDDPRETTTTQIEKEDFELQGRFSSIDLKCGGDNNNNNNNNNNNDYYYYETGANSFVDAILDRDSELRSTFPDFLDESLEYY